MLFNIQNNNFVNKNALKVNRDIVKIDNKYFLKKSKNQNYNNCLSQTQTAI